MRPWCILAVALGCAPREARIEVTSVEGHRQAAAREHAEAEEHRARYEVSATSAPQPILVDGQRGSFLFPLEVYHPFNPTYGELKQAAEHEQHAREHERAAAELQSLEETECRGFTPTTRAACPILGPDARYEALPDGVRIHLSERANYDAIVAHMRCHLAYARARGYAPTATCPLYLAGSEIRTAAPRAVDLVSSKKDVAAKLHELTRTEPRWP
jgi:hypothetical protein